MKRAARSWLVAAALLATAAFAHAQSERAHPAWNVPGGDARRGHHLIAELGCGGCHTIPGVRNARGNVGPPLTAFGDRRFVAGMLENQPDNLIHWLEHPQSVVPGNAMPEMGISQAQARDIAAYLYTLR
jgi:cytochrome c2